MIDRLRTSTQYDFVAVADSKPDTPAQEDGSEEELEFSLFAPTKATSNDAAAPTQRIRIRSPTPEEREPGFIVPRRDRAYYFTGSLNAAQAREYAIAAVTGEDVLARSHSSWPGSRYSWKVIHIPKSQAKLAGFQNLTPKLSRFLPEEAQKKRTRLGKKSRIKKRQRAAVEKAKEEDESKMKAEKELAERAKKAKRNREKKFKKRARDKAKKAAGVGGGDDAPDGDAAESEVGSDGEDV